MSGSTPQCSTANQRPVRPNPGHYLVGDQQHAVLVANLAHPRQIAIRRHDHPVGAGNRLHDHRRHVVRAFHSDHLVNVIGAPQVALRLPRAKSAAVLVWIGGPQHARNARLRGPAPRLAGQRERAIGGSVVRATPRHDLLPSGGQPGDLHRVIRRLGAAQREKALAQRPRRDLRQFAPQLAARLGGEARVDVAQLVGLRLDGFHHRRVLVPNIDVHQLGVQVQEAPSIVVVEV